MICNFQSQDIKAAYEEVRVVLEQPLYSSYQIELDIKEVETVLRQSKVPSFNISVPGYVYDLKWNGENLCMITESLKSCNILSFRGEEKFAVHKILPDVLRKAMQVYRSSKK